MKLRFFSGAKSTDRFIDDLKVLLQLDANKVPTLLDGIVKLSNDKLNRRQLLEQLQIDDKTLRTNISVIRTIAPRVLAGKGTSDAIDELASFGLDKSKLTSLFSAINSLDERERLREWGLVSQISRKHWHSITANVDFKTVTDNGFIVGVVPFSAMQVKGRTELDEKDQNWGLDLTIEDLGELIGILENAKKELETATKNIKGELDRAIAPTRGS